MDINSQEFWERVELLTGRMLWSFRQEEIRDKVPVDVKVFDGIDIGDELYFCEDFEGGVIVYTVVKKEENGYLKVFNHREIGEVEIIYAIDDMFPTLEEALLCLAEKDIEYHGKRLELAKQVMKDVEEGKDLEKYIEGVSL